MKDDVKDYCNNCEPCALSKHYGKSLEANLEPLPIPQKPFELVATDIMHMPQSESGNQYILAFICHLTKYLVTFPMKAIDSKAIADEFYNGFCKVFAFPQTLLSDKGSNFVSETFESMLGHFKIEHKTSVPYHHQTNGLVERVFRTLRQGFRAFASSNPETWDQYLTPLTLAYNSAIQSTTKASPYFAIFGHEPHLPIATLTANPIEFANISEIAQLTELQSSDDVNKIQRFHLLWKAIQNNIESAKQLMQARVSAKANADAETFKIGDLVILKLDANPPGQHPKMTQHRGPAMIKQINYPNLLIRLRENQIVVDKTVHINQVRRYHGKCKDPELADNTCKACDRYHIPTRGRRRVQWIQCETCDAWFHQQCITLPRNFNAEFDPWHCVNCTVGTASASQYFASNQSQTLTIATWNVNGIRSFIRKRGLQYLENEKPDILVLQEIKVGKSGVPVSAAVDGYFLAYQGSKRPGYAGVAIYSRAAPKNVKFGVNDETLDCQARVLTADFEQFYVINVYVPHSGEQLENLDLRNKFDITFMEYVSMLRKHKPVIIAGDFNVAHGYIDVHKSEVEPSVMRGYEIAGFSFDEQRNFDKLLASGYDDAFRRLNPLSHKFTAFLRARLASGSYSVLATPPSSPPLGGAYKAANRSRFDASK
ncbi:MAG: exodeoxyribonuclease III [Pseudomonadota bacterium]